MVGDWLEEQRPGFWLLVPLSFAIATRQALVSSTPPPSPRELLKESHGRKPPITTTPHYKQPPPPFISNRHKPPIDKQLINRQTTLTLSTPVYKPRVVYNWGLLTMADCSNSQFLNLVPEWLFFFCAIRRNYRFVRQRKLPGQVHDTRLDDIFAKRGDSEEFRMDIYRLFSI